MANNDRLEREINEILGKIEQFPDAESRAKRNRRRNVNRFTSRISEVQRGIARQLSRVSVSQLMLASFLMILFAFFFLSHFHHGAVGRYGHRFPFNPGTIKQ